jgi:hypothetical protein
MSYVNQRGDIKHPDLAQGKEIILFIQQRLKLTILVDHRCANLVWDPPYNAPSTPSIGLFSQYTYLLKEREWIEWKKRGLRGNTEEEKLEKAWARKGDGKWAEFHHFSAWL